MWGLPDPSRLYGNQRALYKGSLYAGIYQRSVCWRTQLADALEKIELARPAKSFGIVFWWIILGSGILTAGVSIYLMASQAGYNYIPARKTGLLLLSAGFLNALTVLTAVHAPTKFHPPEEVLQEESPWGL